MITNKIKVAILYNETNPDEYKNYKVSKNDLSEFVPYFELENLSPIDEFKIIKDKIAEQGYDVYTFNMQDNFYALIENLRKQKPDVIFNFIEIFNDQQKFEINIAGIFELMKIPYTGASAIALANCQDKILTKRILKSAGIKTPDFQIINEQKKRYTHKLNYPLIIKPAFEDASAGIDVNAVVKNHSELKNRIEFLLNDFQFPFLLEEFIDGRELNVAILGDKKLEVLPISEIDFSKMPENLPNIVSYQAKWDQFHEVYHKTIPVCPANLSFEIEQKIKNIAIDVFKIMGVRDYARIDMRLSKENEIFVLEVNPNPDLTEGAGFMRSAEAAGYSYDEILIKIINFALQRKVK
ncbi:MAG: ATP-grasp domain-containing protein [Ignavibacterium sp.]